MSAAKRLNSDTPRGGIHFIRLLTPYRHQYEYTYQNGYISQMRAAASYLPSPDTDKIHNHSVMRDSIGRLLGAIGRKLRHDTLKADYQVIEVAAPEAHATTKKVTADRFRDGRP